jgi:hypothetical protein
MTEEGGTVTDKKPVMCHGIEVPVDIRSDIDIPSYSFFLFSCHK